MAAKTLTYTQNYATQPKSIVAGTNTVAWDFNSGATKLGTLSDVVILGKIPNKALVTQKAVRFGTTSEAAHYALVAYAVEAGGTFSLHATLIASMTSSATAASVFTNFIPQKISLSDDRAVQYAVLALNCTTGASETVSVSIQGSIQYLTDGSSV